MQNFSYFLATRLVTNDAQPRLAALEMMQRPPRHPTNGQEMNGGKECQEYVYFSTHQGIKQKGDV